jgi:hypothetical protein
MINQPDSFSKMVTAFFAALTKKEFTFQNQTFKPKTILISPLLWRGYTCPNSCGGCCHRVTLDFLPTEPQPEGLTPRTVEFDGRAYLLMSDLQEGNTNSKCHHLRLEDGRCMIHNMHPALCDVELVRAIQFEEKALLVSKKYDRGYAFHRVDRGRGSLCEMTDVTDETRTEVVRKLKRIKAWTDYFSLESWIEQIIEWAESYPIDEPLRLSVEKTS